MNSPSWFALLLAVLAAVGLVISSGAVAWDPPPIDPLDDLGDDSVDVDIELHPTSDYATMQNGEIFFDITPSNTNLSGNGLNPGARVTIDDVATMHNNGSEWARVHITDDATGLGIQVDGDPIQSPQNNINLTPNETVGLDMVVNTSAEHDFSDPVTLEINATVPEQESEGNTNSGSIALASATETTEVRTMNVTVLNSSGVREILIEGMWEGAEIPVPPLDLQVGDNGTTINTLEMTAPADGNATVNLTDGEGAPPENAIETATNRTPIAGFELYQESGPRFDTFTIIGTVPNSTVPAGTDRSDLHVVQLPTANGTWETLETNNDIRDNGSIGFDATTGATGEYAVAAPIPQISVENATIESTTVDVGESLTVQATVENGGTTNGSETIPIRVANETVEERTVNVSANESTQFVTEFPMTETGTFTVTVGTVEAGEVTVLNETAQISVENATIESTTVDVETNLTVQAIVKNDGRTNGSETIPIQVANETVEERTVNVSANASTQFFTDILMTETGNFTVSVGTVEAGEVTVLNATEATQTVEEPAAINLERLLGLGFAGLLGVALITLFRRVST